MPECLSANQLVAYNLTRIRKMRGMSQQQAADVLAPYLGVRWSKAVYSAAERSYQGKRVRQFTADDVLAMALAFGVPVAYFYLPPKPDDRAAGAVACSGGFEVSWAELFEAMIGGDWRMAFAQRAFELPRDERVHADSYLAQIINSMGGPRSVEDAADMKARADAAFPEGDDANGRRPVAAAILVSHEGVLVSQRNDRKPPWGFITGEVEPHESAADAIIREVKEEAELLIRVGRVIGRRVHPLTGRAMIYVAATPTHGTEIHVGDKAELAEVRWVGLAEAEELLPGMYEPVREYLARELAGGPK